MKDASSSESMAGEATTEYNERLKKRGIQGLIEEFNEIKAEPLPGKTSAFDQNMQLNRYGNIPLLDNSRVILNDGLQHSYIHASYVDGYNRPKGYIICQDSIIDYWRMVWQERITLIVCLTSLRERGNPKADIFFPPETARPYRAGPFRIVAESINEVPGLHRVTLIHLRLECWFARKSVKDRLVVMLYYGNWPDTAVPQNTSQFLRLARTVKKLEIWTSKRAQLGNGDPPSLVHCSAGVGRSATLVACRNALDQLEATDKVDVAGVVRQLRRQRAMAVQNVLQYVFINLLVEEAVRQRRGGQ